MLLQNDTNSIGTFIQEVKTIHTKKTFTIFSQKLAGYLMMCGFVLLGLGKSELYPKKNVFFFTDSPQLQERIQEFNTTLTKKE